MQIHRERGYFERIEQRLEGLQDIDRGKFVFARIWYLCEAEPGEVGCLGAGSLE